jgi:hypothetical protein
MRFPSRTDVLASIQWGYTSCGDEGMISGWEQSPFDLRTPRADHDPGQVVQIEIDEDTSVSLGDLVLLDTTSERLVFRARPTATAVLLAGSVDALDELLGYVAAETREQVSNAGIIVMGHRVGLLNELLGRFSPRVTRWPTPQVDPRPTYTTPRDANTERRGSLRQRAVVAA